MYKPKFVRFFANFVNEQYPSLLHKYPTFKQKINNISPQSIATIMPKSCPNFRGAYGEAAAHYTFARLGYSSLQVKLPANQGLDGLFIKYQDTKVYDLVAVESKHVNKQSPEVNTKLLRSYRRTELYENEDASVCVAEYTIQQMSREWLEEKIFAMQNSNEPRLQESAELMINNFQLLLHRRKLNVVNAKQQNSWYNIHCKPDSYGRKVILLPS